jgi:hypothetical protein
LVSEHKVIVNTGFRKFLKPNYNQSFSKIILQEWDISGLILSMHEVLQILRNLINYAEFEMGYANVKRNHYCQGF